MIDLFRDSIRQGALELLPVVPRQQLQVFHEAFGQREVKRHKILRRLALGVATHSQRRGDHLYTQPGIYCRTRTPKVVKKRPRPGE